MKKNLKDLFKEDVREFISDDTLDAIEEAIQNKTELAVQVALEEQDEIYAEKLDRLMKSMDKDRTVKMKKLLEAVDKDKTAKLVKVIKKYEREQDQDIKNFKKQIVESVGAFVDEYIEESIPTEDFKDAVRNKTAMNVLENLRKVFSIDLAVMKESVANPIMEGKKEIDTLRKKVDELEKTNKLLKEEKEKNEVRLFLEGKTSKFSDTKKKFIHKTLGDRSLQFIESNFEYAVRLFDKQEKKQLETLKEEALESRKHKPDFVKEEVIVEEKASKEEPANPYLTELEKMRF